MSRAVVSFEDEGQRWFAVWSTIVDAPITGAGTEEALREWWALEYGRSGADEIDGVVERAKEHGSSWRGRSLESVMWLNRAGPGEAWLSRPGLIAKMRGRPVLPEHILPDSASEDDSFGRDEWEAFGKDAGDR